MTAIAAVVLTGCADTNAAATPPEPRTNDAMVIEVSVGGGLVPAEIRVSDSLPRVWIAGDGRYLRQTTDGYGNPALVSLEERWLPGHAITGLLDDARESGLLADDPGYGDPRIADAMVTRVVTVIDGTRRAVLISALGYPDLGLTDQQAARRARLSKLLETLAHPERLADVSAARTYTPSAIAVFVLGAAEASPTTPAATWPLGALSDAGTTTDWPGRSARCLVVSGGDAASVVSAAAGNDRYLPWRATDGLWNIALRPLLPDEHRCADVVG